MDYKFMSLLVLLSIAYCDAFFWSSQNDYNREQPVVKQWPLSYVRTYTYHPVQFPTQTAAPISSFQVSRFLPSIFSSNASPSKSLAQPAPVQPAASSNQPSVAAPQPQQQPQPQPQSQSSMPPPPASHSQSYMPAQVQSPNVVSMAPQPLSQPNDFSQAIPMQPMQMQPQSSFFGGSPMAPKPVQYMSDPSSFQFIPNVSPYNMQHVQFVPCMCPITVSIPPEVEKRADDPSMSIESQNTVDDN